ncbi:alpha/beta fold hydrolase [Gymnodinialimonas sp. 2305UL16-5]|uniref:alpha/beta fold hydrolase n=1 Tax=Gymnodinialimonas mytili TaxID=3126503 RepID=UPI0030A8C098
MPDIFFFSRRAYNASSNRFSSGRARLTRYVQLDRISDIVASGQILDQSDWVARVLAQAAGGPILCFVHGFNTSQIEMLRRMEKIRAGLSAQGFSGAVIAYDWPSQGRISGYLTDRNTAKAIAPFLVVDGLVPFMNARPRPKIHVLAHSMGGLVTVRGFSQVGDGHGAPWSVDQVLFASADVDAVELTKGTGHARVLAARSARFTNYFSNQDKVLKLGENIVSGGRDRLGFDGMPQAIEAGMVDTGCGTRYAQTIVKPPAASDEQVFSHRWYFDDTRFMKDAAKTLAGVPEQNMGSTRGVLVGAEPDQALLP